MLGILYTFLGVWDSHISVKRILFLLRVIWAKPKPYLRAGIRAEGSRGRLRAVQYLSMSFFGLLGAYKALLEEKATL